MVSGVIEGELVESTDRMAPDSESWLLFVIREASMVKDGNDNADEFWNDFLSGNHPVDFMSFSE